MRISDWSSDVCSSDLQFDATNAKRVTDAINAAIPNSASMIDGASIAIRASGNGDERMRLMSKIEHLGVTRAEPPAKVIDNARTGTVVINGAVRVDRKSTRLNPSH